MLVLISILVWLAWKRRLLLGIAMIGAFVLFLMWMVGLVRISMALRGSGSVNSQCSIQVFSQDPKGENMRTLAWMMQRSICFIASQVNHIVDMRDATQHV
ncbi:hypothetical protein Cpir12675_001485 [Ceratocystis pirilliformis]|uniref:Uncharacterized protein n=1 Tax=Ceratocystis pirilliformis TaxID=259994 RepID=A0ABR3ZGI2_9PEZI